MLALRFRAFLCALLCWSALYAPASAAPLTVLTSFPGFKNGGEFPLAPIVVGTDGSFYGVTGGGGSSSDGSIYRLRPDSSSPTGYTLRFLWYFSGSDGSGPSCRLTEGTDGSFYGTTPKGGAHNDGTVFQLAPDPNAPTGYTLHTLHSFNGSDGQYPSAGLSLNNGILTGTAPSGGLHQYFGTVFRLTPDSSAATGFRFTVLYNFNGTDGYGPDDTPLIVNGLIYGETEFAYNGIFGTVYRLAPDGSSPTGYSVATLYAFTGGADGGGPRGNLRPDGSGGFFSATGAVYVNGVYTSDGTVFHLVPDASANTGYALTTLHTFHGPDGQNPVGVTHGADGNLYGATSGGGTNGGGTVFQLAPDASASTGYTLHTLYYTYGKVAYPYAAPLLLSDGLLYGTTQEGGDNNDGAVYRIDPNGQNAPVSITGLSPAQVKACTAFTLTVTATGIMPGAAIEWNGQPQSAYLSGNQLSTSISAATNMALTHYPGTVTISVVNPDTGTATKTLTITVPVPVIGALSPNTVPAHSPGFALVVTGSCFAPGEKVHFGSAVLSATFVSPTQLRTFVPANLLTGQGEVSVYVSNPANGDRSGSLTFKIPLTTLSLTVGTITQDKTTHHYSVPLTLTNTGYRDAASAELTFAEIVSANPYKHEDTNVPLPLDIGTLAPGGIYHVTLDFNAGAKYYRGPALQVKGTYTNGAFNLTQGITLPQ